MEDVDKNYVATKLKGLLDRAKNSPERQSFIETFKEVRQFAYDKDGAYNKFYTGWRLDHGDMKAEINRVSEYVEIFGAHLYPQNPDVQVNAQNEPDQWDLKRFKLEEQVLDYCMRKGNLETSLRKSLNQALQSGRGMLWFGWNARKGIPYAIYDSVDNFFMDPDAKCPEEINWIARKRCKPRFEFKKAIGADALVNIDEIKASNTNGDIIEYYEMYFRTGVHNYCQTKEDVLEKNSETGEMELDDSPKKFIICEGKLVAKTDWEIPFFMIDAWPCRYLDFRLPDEGIWSISPIKPGLCHLKALNWVYTTYLNRVKRTAHMTFVRTKIRGSQMSNTATEDAMGIGEQADAGIIDVTIPPGVDPDVKKLLQPLMLDAGMAEFDRAWAITNRALEDAIGLNDLMRSGQDTRQIRTAEDAQLKATRSMSRVEDMQKQFRVFFNQVTESLAFIARYLMSSEDISKLFGPQAGALWADIGNAEMKEQDNMIRMQQANMMMQQAIMQSQQEIAMGMMPTPPPTPEQIEEQLGPPRVIVMEDWINSASREIEASSMRVIDQEAQVENLNLFFSALAPIIGPGPGGLQMIAAAFAEFASLNRYSQSFQNAAKLYQKTVIESLMMPPMLPPPGGNPSKPSEQPDQGVAAASAGQFQ